MKYIIYLIVILNAFVAFAHPVSFKDATAVMTWNQSFMTDNWITYSFHPKMAVAARTMRLEMPEGRMDYYAPQFDFLVKRWNETNSQANIYIYGSYGIAHFLNQTDRASQFGMEVDAESRKYYISVQYDKMWTPIGPDMDILKARLGIAPYEAEFNEVASWFMIQYQRHPTLVKQHVVTPLVRIFYKSFLFEGGVSTDGDWMTNFMFHF
ncbi:hypothetical protein K2X05_00210 [bacterium]|nr:hypothetical protein [bacterium]